MSNEIKSKEVLDTAGIVNDLTEVAKAIEPIIEGFKQVIKTGQEVNKALGLAKTIKDISVEAKNASDNVEKYTASRTKLSEVEKQAAGIFKEYIASLTTTNDGVKQLNKYYSELEKTTTKQAAAQERLNKTHERSFLKEEAAATKRAIVEKKLLISAQQAEKGSTQQLIAVNNILINRMSALNPLIPEQAKLYTQLSNAVARNRDRITELSGQSAVAVKGVNRLGFQLQQVARELPAIAYGPQVFFAAISNNIPILRDEIEKVRIENELLRKSGVNTIPVWRQLASSLFSWQTALVAGLTILTLYGNDIAKWVSGLFKAKNSLDSLRDTQDEFNKVQVEGTRNAQAEIVKLNALFSIAKDISRPQQDRISAIEELQRLYPDYLSNLTEENIRTEDTSIAYIRLTSALIATAKAKASLSKIEEIAGKIVNLEEQDRVLTQEEEKWKTYKKQNQAIRSSGKGMAAFLDATENVNTANERLNALFSARQKISFEIFDLTKQANEYQKNINIASLLTPPSKSGRKKPEEKDDSLARLKEQQKAELEATKQQQELLLQNTDLSAAQRRQAEFDNEQELLQMQLRFMDEQLAIVEKGSLDELKIITDKAELRTKIEENLTKRLINEQKIRQKELEDLFKKERDTAIGAAGAAADAERVQLQKEATKRLDSVKGNRVKEKRIEVTNKVDLLQVEAKYQQDRLKALDKSDADIIANQELTEETRTKLLSDNNKQREDVERQYASLTEDLQGVIRDGTEQVERARVEQIQNTLSLVGDASSQVFSTLQSVFAMQMQNAEALYKNEVALAGNSSEKRILAERKYDREKAKIQRKQAIVAKAQAIFEIGLNTAVAIVKALTLGPVIGIIMAGIVGALGAAQLAIAIATKTPQFAEGTDNAPARFIAGEEGFELIRKRDGSMELTPDKATLYDDRSYKGATIIPHDETQKMLANYAVNNTYDMIDMSESNRYLKKLVKNTAQNTDTWTDNRYRYIRKGNRTSKIRL